MFATFSNEVETIHVRRELIDSYGVGKNGKSFIVYHSGTTSFTFLTEENFDLVQAKALGKKAVSPKKRK